MSAILRQAAPPDTGAEWNDNDEVQHQKGSVRTYRTTSYTDE